MSASDVEPGAAASPEARRRAFQRAAEALLRAPDAAPGPLALILIELNDADPAAESRALARLARDVVGAGAVARLRAGVLALLAPSGGAAEAAALARKSLAQVDRPACAGARWADGGAEDAVETLLSDADAALREARLRGTDVRVFDADLRDATAARRRLGEDLREAAARGELIQVYQPQMSTRRGPDGSRALLGFEALTRWRRAGGETAPSDFVPAAEASGQIALVDLWGLREAAAQLARWRGLGAPIASVSVNVSAALLGSTAIVDAAASALAETGAPAANLTIEITETAPLRFEDPATRAALEGLRALGLGLAIDDFGCGYANYAALARLPATALKIDQSFIALLEQGRRGAALYQGFAALADGLGLKLLVEGVETEAQSERLAAAGCAWGQGLLFGAPMSAEAASALIAAAPPSARADGA